MKNFMASVLRKIALVAVSVTLVVGCASNEKRTVTGLDQVKENQSRLETTNKKIARAQDELSSFQNTLRDLRQDFKESDMTTSRREAVRSLESLSLKIEQAQLDLKELNARNRVASQDLDQRLKDAASSNRRIMDSREQPAE